MLKKKLGAECIEERIINCHISWFYKVPSTLIIPEGCRGIRFEVFDSCRKLKKVEIPESVKKIEKYAFAGCISLKEVVIPKSVEKIGDCAFYSCNKLEKVVIPGSVKEINNWAFGGCTSAEITIENTEKSIAIGRCVFDGCRKVSYAEEETRY